MDLRLAALLFLLAALVALSAYLGSEVARQRKKVKECTASLEALASASPLSTVALTSDDTARQAPAEVEPQFFEHRESYAPHYARVHSDETVEALAPEVVEGAAMHGRYLNGAGLVTADDAQAYRCEAVAGTDPRWDFGRGRVYLRDGATLETPHHGHGSMFGCSTDARGAWLAVGARGQSMRYGDGAVYLYRDGALAAVLESPQAEAGGMFGWCVRFVADRLLLVTAPLERHGLGRGYVFRLADDGRRPLALGQVACGESGHHYGLDARLLDDGRLAVLCRAASGELLVVRYEVRAGADGDVQWDRFDGEITNTLVTEELAGVDVGELSANFVLPARPSDGEPALA